jgi:hypothetical protein
MAAEFFSRAVEVENGWLVASERAGFDDGVQSAETTRP